jgi:hypothetical protein
MRKLGKLQRVDDLRSVWQNEAHDFTPWLRDHIDLLAEAVGLELDLVETESPVGDYAVDLYAKDLNTGRWVIIENQLEQTDHNHLGQLMAYAAGKEAGVIIWISPQFRDEHRQTLDWLNEITDETVSFFGIELELLRVDDSPPAPHFKLVAQPNEWQKIISRPQTVSPRQQAYQAFFGGLLDKVKTKYPNLTKAKKAYPQNWFTFPVGRSGFSISATFTQDNLFRVELYIDTGDKAKNKAAFDALYEDREAIEASVGHPVIWQRLDDRQASRIYCGTDGSIDDNPARLEELQDWAVDLVWTFHQVFKPRVQKLKL